MKLAAVLLVVLVVPATAWAVASDADLELLVAQIEAEDVRCEEAREVADQITRDNTRPLFRALLLPISEAGSLDQAKQLAAHALEVLAAPGGGASKVIHTANRVMGATCIQGIRRAAGAAGDLIGD